MRLLLGLGANAFWCIWRMQLSPLPLGELTALPKSLSWIWIGATSRRGKQGI